MKKRISVIYRIGRLKKWHLSVHIGIGRYEKNLIGRTLGYRHSKAKIQKFCLAKFLNLPALIEFAPFHEIKKKYKVRVYLPIFGQLLNRIRTPFHKKKTTGLFDHRVQKFPEL